MKRRALSDRLYRKRLLALSRELPKARIAEVEAIHRTRVASRRLREALPVVGAALDAARVRKARRAARQITRTIGRVRELDVALELIGDLEIAHLTLKPTFELLRRELEHRRHEARADMSALFERTALDPAVRRLERFGRSLNQRIKTRVWRSALAERLEDRASSLIDAIDEAGALYDADRIHRVRIALKKLRYVVELAGEMARLATARPLKRLHLMQDLLGRMHDLVVLAREIRDLQAGAPALHNLSMRELDALASVIDEEIRRLHGRYVSGRSGILEVAQFCRADLLSRVLAAAPEPVPATSVS